MIEINRKLITPLPSHDTGTRQHSHQAKSTNTTPLRHYMTITLLEAPPYHTPPSDGSM